MMIKNNNFSHGRVLSLLGIALAISGCASQVSQNDFQNNPGGASNLSICKSLRGNEASADPYFRRGLLDELGNRGFNAGGCQQLIDKERTDAALAIGAVAAVAAVANEAHKENKKEREEDKKYREEGWRLEKEYYRGSVFWVCRNQNTGKEGDERYCKGERDKHRDEDRDYRDDRRDRW